jgi:hypothetical protein
MKRSNDRFWIGAAAVAVLLIGAGAAVYYFQRERASAPAEPVAGAAAPASVPEAGPRPVTVAPPQPERTMPLPPLDESDAEVLGGLTELFGRDAITQFVVPERIVRNAVVTIDNLPREKMALQQRPIQPTPGEFIASGSEEAPVIAAENYARYAPFIAVVESIDAKTLVALYRGLQPLFQQAYEELGHPNAFFNTRLLEVIEHLLETPEVAEPIALVRPSVYYRYADKNIEALSSGQKLLIRMGPANARIVKAKLREIQAELL